MASLATGDCPEHTALLMRRNAEGRRFRLRATEGTLRPPDLVDIPTQFRTLLPHFRRKTTPASDERVQQADYTNMLAADGSPKPMDWVEWLRKMGDIVKGKAPGCSDNTPDLYTSLPRVGAKAGQLGAAHRRHAQWVAHRPSVHKGGDDGPLSNHRQLCLIEVLRKR